MKKAEKPIGVKEAAEILGCSDQTVRSMARRQQIPCFKVGKHFKFLASKLIAWRDGQMASAEQAQPAMSSGAEQGSNAA